MTATNHCLSGGLIGALLPLPIAIPIAFISHFALDSLPHYGVSESAKENSKTFRQFVVVDTLIALSLGVSGVVFHKWALEVCGWAAFAPDIWWVVKYYRHGKTLNMEPTTKFTLFHSKIQREYAWGIFVELTMAIFTFPIVWKFITK